MSQNHVEEASLVVMAEQRGSAEVIKLIRKLRWIGLEAEAKKLQAVLSRLPAPRSGTVVAGPHSTD